MLRQCMQRSGLRLGIHPAMGSSMHRRLATPVTTMTSGRTKSPNRTFSAPAEPVAEDTSKLKDTIAKLEKDLADAKAAAGGSGGPPIMLAINAALAGACVYLYMQKIDTTPVPSGTVVKNKAFIFVKPHANTEKSRAMVKAQLEKKGLTVLKEGQIDAKDIDAKMLIDNHYYSIASKATLLKPEELNVPENMFKDKFGK